MPVQEPRPETAAEAKPAKEASATGQKAKEAAAVVVAGISTAARWIRDETSRLYASYQRQNRFFKYRSWIVATWAVLTVSSLAVALWPDNVMGAVVRIAPDPADRSPIISVENDSGKMWHDVVIVLDGVYTYTAPSLSPGERIQEHARKFVHKDFSPDEPEGTPPRSYRPQRVTVRSANGGSYSTRLN